MKLQEADPSGSVPGWAGRYSFKMKLPAADKVFAAETLALVWVLLLCIKVECQSRVTSTQTENKLHKHLLQEILSIMRPPRTIIPTIYATQKIIYNMPLPSPFAFELSS